MNTTTLKNAGIGLALATTLLFGATAACAAPTNYRFEEVGQPSGTKLTIRLIDEATGKAITDAHVFAVHRQWLPVKGEPRSLDRRIALTPDGQGDFVYDSNDVETGTTIRLVAQVDDSNADIWGSVRVGQ